MDAENKSRPVISADGLQKLEQELLHYKTVKRKEIAEQIKQAISFGDLSENAEYDEAKNEQSRIEGHISYLENTIRNATVIDASDVSTEIVGVGSVVQVIDTRTGTEAEYKIVGETEADPLEDKISNESPVGAALINQRKGANVTFSVPDGLRTLQILDIRRA
ncbi:MAG: transcription elongation factor GreA [Oscillospiraceae bacterium]|jgi:transcription elongation factor GreA|nr:transcription elongation factor GreA [Oscillospiraceae bacterium]